MQLTAHPVEFESVLPINRKAFVIQSNAHLFGILSDQIYSDKILAVIRELSCNAHDSQIIAKTSVVLFCILTVVVIIALFDKWNHSEMKSISKLDIINYAKISVYLACIFLTSKFLTKYIFRSK